jgi:hypothetical protein
MVKPIVLNRRIEVVAEPHFDPDALPFEPLAIADMLAAPQTELEAFLTQIYRSVVGGVLRTSTRPTLNLLCIVAASA